MTFKAMVFALQAVRLFRRLFRRRNSFENGEFPYSDHDPALLPRLHVHFPHPPI